MAPQTSIPVAANVLGTIGTVFWCIQLVPQIWYNWKQKKTDGLPALMMFLWAISAVPFGVYAIVQNFNIPIQIQPQVFCALSLVSWAQILIYNSKWPTWKASCLATSVGAFFGGVEALLIVTLAPIYDRGVAWPIMIVGIVAAILLAAGLLPPYFELWKRSGRVVGINFAFLAIDWLGAFFSLMGVVTQNTFDPLGGCLFIVCITIEGGIFLSHFLWLFRTRTLRAAARAAGQPFDVLPEADIYHVDAPRKGSIAASRDFVHDELARRGSAAMIKSFDLERDGEALGPSCGIGKSEPLDTVVEVGSVRSGASASQREDGDGEVVREGDYGIMDRAGAASRMGKRPGFARQDTFDFRGFKESNW